MSETTEKVEEKVQAESTDTQDTAKPKEKKAPKLSKKEQELADLRSARMGNFKVGLDISTATYLKNLLDKVEWKGPQQAYLLLIAKAEMVSVCTSISEMDKMQRHEVEISSATIESLSFFMNAKTGKGQDAAHKLFGASMILRPAMSQINELDTKIAELQPSPKK